MKPFIGEIYEGTYHISQLFGERPEVYARFAMKGHNGVDFALPIGTKLYFGCRVRVSEIRNDPAGFGKMVRAIHEGLDDSFELTWAHMSVFNPDITIGGYYDAYDSPGLSGHTGFSTGPHLHFQVRVLSAGGMVRNYSNGYKGAIDPLPLFDLGRG